MLITVITINLNNAAGLQATMDSVVAQDFGDYEYIVIDGGSTDDSQAVIEKYSSKLAYWVSEKDNGLYDAMNKGITQAKGQYLMFLNSGDWLEDNTVLSVGARYISKHPATDVFYGDAWFTSKNPPSKYLHKHPPLIDVGYFENYHLNHQAALIKADFFKEFGPYPTEYRWAGDHWMFLQAMVGGKVFTHIDYLMVVYDDNGISIQNQQLYKAEARQLWEKLVPNYVNGLLDELKVLRRIKGFKLVKLAYALSEKIEKYRKR